MHHAHHLASSVAWLAAAGTLVLGCGSDKPARTAQDTRDTNEHPVQITSAEAPRMARQAAVVIAPDIRAICHIEEVSSAPKFAFDRADVQPDDRAPLDQLAKCLTTGPLKGQRVMLTGRADPRGEEEYNMVLGSSRASSVGDYLKALGVPPASLEETSRGELDATGDNEATWAIDRRVDIRRAP